MSERIKTLFISVCILGLVAVGWYVSSLRDDIKSLGKDVKSAELRADNAEAVSRLTVAVSQLHTDVVKLTSQRKSELAVGLTKTKEQLNVNRTEADKVHLDDADVALLCSVYGSTEGVCSGYNIVPSRATSADSKAK